MNEALRDYQAALEQGDTLREQYEGGEKPPRAVEGGD